MLLTPVGLILGLLLSFIGFPLFHKLRKTPDGIKKAGCLKKILAAFLFTVVFVPTIIGLGLWLSYKDQNNFWEYQGAFDFWRMPLEEPYQLVMIDTIEQAGISKWQDGSSIINGIAKYEKRGSLIAGYCERKTFKPEKAGWLLFDCVTGKAEFFASEQLLTETCEKRGFSPPIQMKTIRENWILYWQDLNRRRK
jgi:hypothetical protein